MNIPIAESWSCDSSGTSEDIMQYSSEPDMQLVSEPAIGGAFPGGPAAAWGRVNPPAPTWGHHIQLVIMRHSVHKVTGDAGLAHDREYVVSNMRPFTIDVQLINHGGEQPQDCCYSLPVSVSLCYENGAPVRPPGAGSSSASDPLLLGDVEVTLVGGRRTLKLQMGKDALTSKLGRQRLRVKVR